MKNSEVYILNFREVDRVIDALHDNTYRQERLEDGTYNMLRNSVPISDRFKDNYVVGFSLHHYVNFIANNDLTPIAKKMIDAVFLRYEMECCVRSNTIDFLSDKSSLDFFASHLVSIMEENYLKYVTLLELYEDNKNKLIGKLQTITETESSTSANHSDTHSNESSSQSLFKDTPETQIVVTDDKYNSNVTANSGADSGSSSGSSSSSGSATTTTSMDKDLIINQINEVQDKYRKVMRDFTNEFKSLFWEEANYE